MGLRFRKSFGSGPFRMTVSKSGIGYSVGTKGARVTKKAGGGVRTSVGANGIYYIKDYGSGNVSKKTKKNKKSGCMPWIAGFIAVLAIIGIFGSCSPDEETKEPQKEETAIVQDQEVAEDPIVEEEEEQAFVEIEPVFLDPYGGDKEEEASEPVVESGEPVEEPEEPVVENGTPVVDTTAVEQPQQEETPVVAQDPQPQGQIVYRTKSGEKYHNAGCSSLRKSCIEITLDEAIALGLGACENCH